MFSCEICEISKSTYFEEHLRTTASVLTRLSTICWNHLFCIMLLCVCFSIYVLCIVYIRILHIWWWYCQLSLKLLFRDILETIFHIDFRCGSINFRKQPKQSVEFQNSGIPFNPLKTSRFSLFLKNRIPNIYISRTKMIQSFCLNFV